MFKNILLVGLGGGVGSILRYLTSFLINKHWVTAFPWPTFTVNVLGCLLIGVIFGLSERHQLLNSDMKLLLATGFCGGYTTFSAFAAENLALFQSNQTFTAILYIAASVLLGLLAVWAGMAMAK